MSCKWYGSDRHSSDNCPTKNLVKFLNDEPPTDWFQKLPDQVIVMDFEELLDEAEQRSKTQSSNQTMKGEN